MRSSVGCWTGAATVAILIGAALPATTTAKGSDIIYACVKVQSGQVRFVSAPSECLPSETAIPLNQTGVQGPQGAEGPEGPQGPPGPADLLPAVGQFTPMQLVQGAILTCDSTTTTASDSTCTGPKVNGLAVGTGTINTSLRICLTVTGGGIGGLGAVADPTPSKYDWTGTAWTLAIPSSMRFSQIICAR